VFLTGREIFCYCTVLFPVPAKPHSTIYIIVAWLCYAGFFDTNVGLKFFDTLHAVFLTLSPAEDFNPSGFFGFLYRGVNLINNACFINNL
jgi:hypothetical protein